MADPQRGSLGDRDLDQAITALKKGAYLLKYGRRGKPKFCPFRLSADESALLWYHGKEERQLELRCVSRIIPGQRTAIFKRYPRPEKEYQSFSLIYSDRSLDLICKDKDEAEVWFVGLKALISRGNIRHFRTEGRIESMTVDSPNAKRIYPSIPLEQGETARVESLPLSRLGKAFSDIITYTAANKVQTQSENKVQTQSENKVQTQSENKVQTQSENKVQTQSENKVQTQSENKVQTQSENKVQTPSENKVQNQSERKVQTQSENKVQTQSEQVVNYLSAPPSIAVDSSNGRSSTAETFRVSLSSAVSSSSHGSYREDFDALGDVLIWGEGVGDGVLGGGVHRVGSSLSTKIDALLPKSLESTTVLDVYNIACGDKHAMLVTKQGEIFSWGEEEGGRLGHGVEEDIPQPKRIDTLSGLNIEFVACGEYHSCAVTFSGDLYTWGDGTYKSGLLGHGGSSSYCVPRKVYGLMEGIRVSNISCGPWHTAVVTSTGQLYTFGDGTFGALGHGDRSSTGTPREVETLRGLRTIRVACGVWHTVAVVEVMIGEEEMIPLGKLFTWGNGDKGQLGHGDKEPRLAPACVAGTDDVNFYQVACGDSLTVALTSSGRVYTMGSKVHGELGNPLATGVTPTCVEGTIGDYFIEDIACGSHHVAVLTSKSEVYTWGKGANGQLGHGDSSDRNTPTLVSFIKDKQVKKVFCGANFTAAICLHKLASTADNSMCSGCRNLFNFRRKRHNCYNCGLVFCKVCSSRKSLKASLAPTMTKPYRVCDDCFNKLKRVSETGYVARIPKAHSRNSLNKYETAEKDSRTSLLQGQFTRLSSTDSVNLSESKISKMNMKEEMNDTRLFLRVNENLERASISLKSSSIGANKNLLSPSVPGPKTSSRTPSLFPKLSIATLAPIIAGRTSDVSVGESNQKNERLTEEIVSLKTQVQDLSNKYRTLEVELEKKEEKLKEATELAANEAEKCRAAKEVIKSLTIQLKEMSEKMSEGHIVNRKLDSVARHGGFGDPSSPSSERKELKEMSKRVSERHIVNKRLESVARQRGFGDSSSPSSEHNELKEMSKRVSEEHIVNRRLESVARQRGFGDPSSPSSEHNELKEMSKRVSEGHIVNRRLESVARQGGSDDPTSPSSEHNELKEKSNRVSEGHIVNRRLKSVARHGGFGDPSSPSSEHNELKEVSEKVSEGHIVNRRLDYVARQGVFGDPSSPSSERNESEKVSEGHIVNRRLESVARHGGFGDPSSPSSERNEVSNNSPNSVSTANSSDSPLSNGKKATKDKGEWVVQDEPGVYITLSHMGEGQHELKRVRFSRKRFTEEQAEKWWADNATIVCERHNIRTG